MLSKVNLNRISQEIFRDVVKQSGGLASFKHPAISGAQEAIARLKGKKNFAGLEKRQTDILRACLHTGFLADQPEMRSKFLLVDTDNYEIEVLSFEPIEIARRVLFPDRKQFKAVQLAANYGPYLLYLREALRITGIVGIDIDGTACRYGGKYGLPLIKADAKQLPFLTASQEFIFSQNFLDPFYCSLIDRANGILENQGESIFLREALKEAHRVLQPNGVLISALEFEAWHNDFAPFSQVHRFPKTLQNIFPPINSVVILQKEAA